MSGIHVGCMQSEPSPSAVPHLNRELGLWDTTMIVAGSMIGSGIFIVPSDLARQVGGSGWMLALWVFTGLLTIAAALSYGELAAMMPKAGGQYVYLREAFGPLTGFLYGWTLFLVIQTGTIAAVAVAFARFLGVLWPQVSEGHKWVQFGRFGISPMQLVACVVVCLLTWSNSTGLRAGKYVQNVFTGTKILALAALIVAGITLGWNANVVRANFSAPWHAESEGAVLSGLGLMVVLGTAMVGTLFSSDAWNNVTFVAGEVRNPSRTLPASLVLGVVLVSVLYFLANVSYLVTLPVTGDAAGTTALARGIQHAQFDRVGTAAVEVILGPSGRSAIAALIMVSTFGCINGLVFAGARVYYAMAKDRLFFERVGGLNSKGVPAVGLWVQCVWACLLTLSGSYGDLLDYVIFAVLIFYVLTIAGLFVLRRTQPQAERPYRAWGYPLLPACYIVFASLIAIDLLIAPKTRANAWPGLFLVLAGIPVYYFWKRGACARASTSAGS